MLYKTAAMRPWGRLCLLVATCVLPVISRADSIDTQVSCSTGGQATVTGATSCSVIGADGNTNDDLLLSVSSPVSASGYTAVVLSESGTAHDASPGGQTGATSSASLDLTLSTAGPERSGYLELVMPQQGLDAEFALAQLSFSIGSLDGGCPFPTLYYCSVNVAPVSPGMYNFTLGEPFSLQLAYSDELAAADEDSTAEIAGAFTLQFRFLESDQVTPVALSPEPATWGSIVIAALAALLAGLYRSRTRAGILSQVPSSHSAD